MFFEAAVQVSNVRDSFGDNFSIRLQFETQNAMS
jgi:hypothetical protein